MITALIYIEAVIRMRSEKSRKIMGKHPSLSRSFMVLQSCRPVAFFKKTPVQVLCYENFEIFKILFSHETC